MFCVVFGRHRFVLIVFQSEVGWMFFFLLLWVYSNIFVKNQLQTVVNYSYKPLCIYIKFRQSVRVKQQQQQKKARQKQKQRERLLVSECVCANKRNYTLNTYTLFDLVCEFLWMLWYHKRKRDVQCCFSECVYFFLL